MTAQKRLPGLNPPRVLAPDRRVLNPTFWVRRLRVVSALRSGADSTVREVSFRRGLNIVWTPAIDSPQFDLFADGLAGHTAGKTTLCRFLRFLLGEDSFATEATRSRIRDHFKTGWVLGEVEVANECWAVARPLGIGPRPFSRRGGIEDLFEENERLSFNEFLAAIAEATVAQLPAKVFPGSGEHVDWLHLLPWLSRDQECSFADFREWRHPRSDSGAPSTKSSERELLIRSVLSLVSDDEQAELRRNAELLAAQEKVTRERPLLEHLAHVDHERLKRALGIDLAPPSDGLFGMVAREELAEKRRVFQRDFENLENDDSRARLRREVEDAIAAAKGAEIKFEATENRIAHLRNTIEQLRESPDPLLVRFPPSEGFCQVPISLARARGCDLAEDHITTLSSRRSGRAAQQELSKLEEQLVEFEEQAATERALFQQHQRQVADARKESIRVDTGYLGARIELQKRRSELERHENLLLHAEMAAAAAAKRAEEAQTLEDELRESRARQERIRRRHERERAAFSWTFDYVARALLGDGIEGRIEPSGRGLQIRIERDGDRDSAAVATTKLLAFDLAALTAGIEGHGCFPRFLIHDGPRGADLSPDIYERLFLFVRELERCFEGEPAFQYIITTTTPPPKPVASEPWVVLQLAGSPAESRFLGRDL